MGFNLKFLFCPNIYDENLENEVCDILSITDINKKNNLMIVGALLTSKVKLMFFFCLLRTIYVVKLKFFVNFGKSPSFAKRQEVIK